MLFRPNQALDGLLSACRVCRPVVLHVELVAEVLCHSGRQVTVQACRKCNPLFIDCTGSVRITIPHSLPGALRTETLSNSAQILVSPDKKLDHHMMLTLT